MNTVLYKDLNRKFGYGGASDVLTDGAAITQALYNIFSTLPGEAGPIFEPDFGSMLPTLVHEPMDSVTAFKIEAATIQAVQRWEPRIELDLSRTRVVPDYVNQAFQVTIAYSIRKTGERATTNLQIKPNSLDPYLPFSTLEKLIDLKAAGWPGILEFCVVSPSGNLRQTSGNTWGALTIWSSFTAWDMGTGDSFRYTTLVDNLYEIPRVIRAEFSGLNVTSTAVSIATSSDGVSYSAMQPLPSTALSARFMKIQVDVIGLGSELDTGLLFFYI